MANELQKISIDAYYTEVIRKAKTDEVVFEKEELSIPVVTELYERAKINYENKVNEMKAASEDLLDRRVDYFKELKEKLSKDIEKEYVKLDREVAVATDKASLEKDNKLKLIENKLKVIDDFREAEKEMLSIIDESIQVEKDKQAAGESSWDNLTAFIEDIKAKTLPSFKKKKEEEIDPLLEDVKMFKAEVKKMEQDLLLATEQINVVYSKKILTLNKEYKQEELRVIGLHRRTLKYLDVQTLTGKANLKRLRSTLEELVFKRDQKNEELKKKVLTERKELLQGFSSNLDSEFADLDSTINSFNQIGKIQSDMRQLSSFIREELSGPTQIGKSDSRLLESIVTSEEGGGV